MLVRVVVVPCLRYLLHMSAKEDHESNLQLRTALSNAYAALDGTSHTTTVLALTFEEAVAGQLSRLSDDKSRIRPSERTRVAKIENELLAAISDIKQKPPEYFVDKTQEDVNTEE